MLGNPNETFATVHKNAIFVLSGELATFFVPTLDNEVATVVGERLNDLLKPQDGEVGLLQNDGVSIVTVKVRNTTRVDDINDALARITEHFNLPEIVWTSSPARVARVSPVGVSA